MKRTASTRWGGQGWKREMRVHAYEATRTAGAPDTEQKITE